MRLYKFLIPVVLAVLMFAGCKKDKQLEFVEESISGKLVYINTLQGYSDSVSLPGVNVYMAAGNDFSGYLLKVQSDSAGYYLFTHRRKETVYLFSEAYIDNIRYFGSMEVECKDTPISRNLVLYPDSTGGLMVTVLNSDASDSISGLTVNLYANAADTSGTGGTPYKTATSNVNGRAFFAAMPAGTYYIKVTGTLNGASYSGRGSALVLNDRSKTYLARVVTEINLNKPLTVTLQNDGAGVGGIKVRLYNNLALAQANGAATATATTANGKAVFTGLADQTTYYLMVRDTVGNTIYQGTPQSFSYNATTNFNAALGVTATTLNIYPLTVFLNYNGTGMGNKTVCLFSNEQLANTGNCALQASSATSNATGIITYNGLETGTYYYNFHDTVGNNAYAAQGSLVYNKYVNTTLPINLTLTQLPQLYSLPVQVVDTLSGNAPVYNVTVRLYTNPVYLGAITDAGSIASGQTNAQGIYTFTGLQPGNYYAGVKDSVPGLHFFGSTNAITLPPTPNAAITLKVGH